MTSRDGSVASSPQIRFAWVAPGLRARGAFAIAAPWRRDERTSL